MRGELLGVEGRQGDLAEFRPAEMEIRQIAGGRRRLLGVPTVFAIAPAAPSNPGPDSTSGGCPELRE